MSRAAGKDLSCRLRDIARPLPRAAEWRGSCRAVSLALHCSGKSVANVSNS